MARSPTAASTPRKVATQAEKTARRLNRQQKQLEKELVNEVTAKVATNGGRMVKLGDVKRLKPLTDTQSHVFEAWNNNDADAYILHGSVGTGKTYLAMYFSLLEILKEEPTYRKLIIVRSNVATRDVGYLPGSLEEKMAIFEVPYIQICSELTNNKDAYQKLKDTNKIEFMSSSFMRGTTFDNSIVLIEEFQSFSWHELSTCVTRIGKNTKLICCGDGAQDDLIKSKNDVSGFRDFMQVTRLMPEFRSFKFTVDDIVRSPFVKSFIMACEKMGL